MFGRCKCKDEVASLKYAVDVILKRIAKIRPLEDVLGELPIIEDKVDLLSHSASVIMQEMDHIQEEQKRLLEMMTTINRVVRKPRLVDESRPTPLTE